MPKNKESYSDEKRQDIAQYALELYTRSVKDLNYPSDFMPNKRITQDMEQAYICYLKDCVKRNKVPRLEPMKLWLTISEKDIERFADGTEQEQDFIERVMTSLAAATDDATIERVLNMIYSIFTLKSRHGYIEKAEALKANQPQLLQQNNIFQLSTSNVDADEYLARIRQSGIVVEGGSSGIVEIEDNQF